jgi:hypothetical protein
LRLSSADYADLARRLQRPGRRRRVLVVLEGGYDLGALAHSTGATLSALLGESYRPEEATTGEIGLPTVTAAKQLWEGPTRRPVRGGGLGRLRTGRSDLDDEPERCPLPGPRHPRVVLADAPCGDIV